MADFWSVSIELLMSSIPQCAESLVGIVPSAPTTIGTTLHLAPHNLPSSLHSSSGSGSGSSSIGIGVGVGVGVGVVIIIIIIIIYNLKSHISSVDFTQYIMNISQVAQQLTKTK